MRMMMIFSHEDDGYNCCHYQNDQNDDNNVDDDDDDDVDDNYDDDVDDNAGEQQPWSMVGFRLLFSTSNGHTIWEGVLKCVSINFDFELFDDNYDHDDALCWEYSIHIFSNSHTICHGVLKCVSIMIMMMLIMMSILMTTMMSKSP